MANIIERRSILKIACAWCGKDMGEKEGEGIEGTSHSICPNCLEKILSQGEPKSIPGSN